MKVVFTMQPTINTGDFSNLKLGITLEDEIEPGEDVVLAYNQLAETGRGLLRDQIVVITEPGYIRRRALAQIGIVEEQESTPQPAIAEDDSNYDIYGGEYEDGDAV